MKIPDIASHESSGKSPRVRNASRQPAASSAGENLTAVKPHPVQREEVAQAAAELDKVLKQTKGDLSVSVDETTGVMVVRITDSTTGEVVKQVPPQELMDANRNMNKIVGLLLDDRA